MSNRVLVTGASGFIGRHLVSHLVERGSEVAVITRTEKTSSDALLTKISWAGDPTSLVEQIHAFSPSTVYHLATHFLSGHEPHQIPALIDANVTFGTVILESAHQVSARVILTGSAWQHFEGASYRPVSLYAATKQALIDVSTYYVDQGLDVRELILFDTYGPKDTRRKLIPTLLDVARSQEPLPMSSGHQLIDLLYVTDVVDALIRTAGLPRHEDGSMQSFVARSAKPLTIREVVNIAERATERPIPVDWGARPSRPREMITNWEFGEPLPDWAPKVDLMQGIRECWVAGQL